MHLHGYSSAFPRIRTNHHYMAQPDDFGPRRAHGAFGLFCLTRIYLPTCLPAYLPTPYATLTKIPKALLESLWHRFRVNKVARNLALNALIGFA